MTNSIDTPRNRPNVDQGFWEKRKEKKLLKKETKKSKGVRDAALAYEGPLDNVIDSLAFIPPVKGLGELKKAAVAQLMRARDREEKRIP